MEFGVRAILFVLTTYKTYIGILHKLINMSLTARTRIAIFPTGAPSCGYGLHGIVQSCLCEKARGEMTLRIEDTDQARSTKESETAILDALRWLGLEWDEGPDCGGEYGPYRQSERLEIHQKVVQRLIDEGHAYRCFCSAERLDALRKEQMANKETPRYDGHCLSSLKMK